VPRQTSGDTAVQPKWEETLTITVGTKDADIVGSDQRAIQAAVDHVARLGGGTVRILAGTYRLRNAVYLQSGVHLIGEGDKTLLIKEPSTTTPLKLDSDWYDQEITLHDATGFRVGDGVCLRARDAKTGRQTVLKRTLTARSGNRFKLDKPLRENLWQMNDATCSTLFPLLSGEFVNDLRIENLVLDGNREHNAELDGNYAGCIFLQDCNRIHIRGVTARNNHGDGISWQICHDVVVENCVSENNKNLGLHPGSAARSARSFATTPCAATTSASSSAGASNTASPSKTRSRATASASPSAIATPTTSSPATPSAAASSTACSSAPNAAPTSPATATASKTTPSSTTPPKAAPSSTSRAAPNPSPSATTPSPRPAAARKREVVKQGPDTKQIVVEGS
jgi:hypothetical protein